MTGARPRRIVHSDTCEAKWPCWDDSPAPCDCRQLAPLSERDEILNAADLSGDAWLYHMAKFAEPTVTPEAWATALAMSRTIVADASEVHR